MKTKDHALVASILGLVIGLAALFAYLFAYLFLSGCNSQTSLHPNVGHPARTLVSMPYVLIVGDEIATSWGNYNTNQMWTFAGSPLGTEETSGSVTSRLPTLLAVRHYDVVVLMAGQFDLADPAWDYPSACGYDGIGPSEATCDNIDTMTTEAHQAGAKLVLCLGPSFQPGSLGSQIIDDPERIIPLNVEEYFFYRGWTIGYDPPPVALNEADAIVEMWQVMGQTDTGAGGDPVAGAVDWTDDGIHFNATGAQLATAAASEAIGSLGIDWGVK